jgi:SAM-dependent methyltransferase
MGEVEEIKRRYEVRKIKPLKQTKGALLFEKLHRAEKEKQFSAILKNHFGTDYRELKMLEVGAGTGKNLGFFIQAGFRPVNIWANELLDDRFNLLMKDFPNIHGVPGNAVEMDYTESFDLVLQSTVFTSILDDGFRRLLADKMVKMTKQGGLILWYDFLYDNPRNKDVKGIRKKSIRELFPEIKSITFTKVTLAPPLGRPAGRFYNVINSLFPLLRTHVIAVMIK